MATVYDWQRELAEPAFPCALVGEIKGLNEAHHHRARPPAQLPKMPLIGVYEETTRAIARGTGVPDPKPWWWEAGDLP